MPKALSVTEFTRAFKTFAERNFSDVSIEGEVSYFTPHRSGHWYFAIKDADAVLNCVMFRGNNQGVRWTPVVGDRVVVGGGLDIYAPQGKYNLLVRRIERAGEGDLQRKLEELKRKLAAEGLMAQERKRRLPAIPRSIGIATSPTGAALQDILKVLGRRFPGITLYLAPCRVQGEGAAAEIAAAVRLLGRHGKSEVIIVGRGGGSQEDLACFNEEIVARAIAASPIPTVSAVGHEVDTSIADLVADVRAATPSHAAELVVPERDALLATVAELQQRMVAALRRDVARRRERLRRLVPRDPRRRLADARLRCDELYDRLSAGAKRTLALRRRGLEMRQARLEALSPLAVLGRGYALALKDGHAVRSSAELSAGDLLEIRLAQGSARTRVEGT